MPITMAKYETRHPQLGRIVWDYGVIDGQDPQLIEAGVSIEDVISRVNACIDDELKNASGYSDIPVIVTRVCQQYHHGQRRWITFLAPHRVYRDLYRRTSGGLLRIQVSTAVDKLSAKQNAAINRLAQAYCPGDTDTKLFALLTGERDAGQPLFPLGLIGNIRFEPDRVQTPQELAKA